MQQRQNTSSSSITPRRHSSREEHSPSILFTALTIGAVLILLAVTFLADWLRTPDLSITSSPQFLSPNQDNSFDTASINYRLSEEAAVSVAIYSEDGGLVRSLLEAQDQTAGQHIALWDGSDDLGRRVSDGNYRIEVTAKGSVRARSSSATLRVDTTPPNLQLVNLPEGARVGADVLVIEGLTETDATVWLTGTFQSLPVDPQGRFRTQRKLTEGLNQIELRASDPAGNTTIVTRGISLVTAAPEVVITTPAEGAWVNNTLITVVGAAPPDAVLKINNQSVPVAPDGAFRHDLLMDEGEQVIQVTATDDVGNVTTVERLIHVKTRGPQIELNVAEGTTFSDPQIQLTGRVSPGSLATVNKQPVTVGTVGDFQTSLRLNEGDNVIEVSAFDQAGNTTTITRRVRHEIPTAPGDVERLMENFKRLPALTIPAVILLSLLVGLFLYRQNQLAIQLSVDTQTFTPGLPQEGKNLVLRLDLNQPAHVTLEVLDSNGLTQATLLDNRRRSARQHVFLWDGYDDFGRPVLAGTYVIRATAGAPPIKVSSAVQVAVEEDPYVYRKASQFEKLQPAAASPLQRRRMRQNRKRV